MAMYALLLLAALVLIDWRFEASGGTASRDADIVYCLAPGHLDGLVAATVSLGLASPGSTPAAIQAGGRSMPLGTWRTADGADFERACDAYATVGLPSSAPAAPSTGIQDILTILLPVVAGALLTMAADDFKQASDRRWAQADELRADWQVFQASVLSYIESRKRVLSDGIPSSNEVDTARRALVATLRKIHSQHRKSPTIRILQNQLAADLGPFIADGWDSGDAVGIGNRAKQIVDCLGTFGSSLNDLAGGLERRVWLSSRL
jgi:hypothetical protein